MNLIKGIFKVSLFCTGILSAAQRPDAATTQDVAMHISAIQVLSQKCQDVGKANSLHVEGLEQVTPPLKMHNYEIAVFYSAADENSFNFVGILEKGPEADETAHITRICLNQKDYPTNGEGNIEIPLAAVTKRDASFRFHLNIDKTDAAHLERHKWNSPAAMNMAVSGHTVGDLVPAKPTAPGHFPPCVEGLAVSGIHQEELSFSFLKCLPPPGPNWNYSYQLFPLHRMDDGNWLPRGLDPQIIIHAH